jgi:two-component system, NtrC family, sensor kinase
VLTPNISFKNPKRLLSRAVSSSASSSPRAFLIKTAIAIYVAELLIMRLFAALPKLPDLVETVLDSTLLSLIVSPALYFFIYKPFTQEIAVRARIEAELRQSTALLEEQAQSLEAVLKQLQQASQLIQTEKMSSLGRLVAGIAHEINNPVNFVFANLNYVEQYSQDLMGLVERYQVHYPEPVQEIQTTLKNLDLGFLQEDQVKILNSMRAGCERIRKIVLSLRNFSRMDESDFKTVNVHEGIDSALTILQHRLQSLQPDMPSIEVIQDYGQLPAIDCFPGQLNQVFMNILTNGIDALQSRIGTAVLPRLTIRSAVVDGESVQISIADNGMGMPQSVRTKIFDPFFTTKPVGQGTGMGLAISYQIVVEKHGGSLTCVSTPGSGTEFVIQIPICQTEQLGACVIPHNRPVLDGQATLGRAMSI